MTDDRPRCVVCSGACLSPYERRFRICVFCRREGWRAPQEQMEVVRL